MALRFGFAGLLMLVVACRVGAPPLILATTTSVANSGLLDVVLPSYQSSLSVLQVGSGRALALLASGDAAVAVTHAPEQEADALSRHPKWFYRKVLYNDFLIVGPPNDPAGIAAMGDAAEAMKRIVQSGQRFISRGDNSGTHERERQLWAATATPSSAQVIVAGAGMGQTLRIASESGSYTLTDRGTFAMTSASLHLRELVSGDPRLLNTYAVIASPSNTRGMEFARWLAEGAGRDALAAALSSKRIRGFSVWPQGHDNSRPEARPF